MHVFTQWFLKKAPRNLFKGVFTCQRPQLYTIQVSLTPCRDSQDYHVTKNADGQTDGQTAFQLYIVHYMITNRIILYSYAMICLQTCFLQFQAATCIHILTHDQQWCRNQQNNKW